MPATPDLTPASQDYLKAIYGLEAAGARATTSALAARMDVSAPSATAMAKRLAELGLVERAPYRGVVLTDEGRRALEMLRHHRLLERYLADRLGLSLDEVHAEAERLEHALSEELEAKIDAELGFPTHDPHGDPIPDRELRLVPGAGERLRGPRARRARLGLASRTATPTSSATSTSWGSSRGRRSRSWSGRPSPGRSPSARAAARTRSRAGSPTGSARRLQRSSSAVTCSWTASGALEVGEVTALRDARPGARSASHPRCGRPARAGRSRPRRGGPASGCRAPAAS